MANPVQIRDLGIGRLREQLAKLKQQSITVGHQGASGAAKHPNADATVSQVAAWQEFGTRDIPSRPFVRTALTRGHKARDKAIRDGISDMIDGRKTLEEVQERVGEAMLADVREAIDDAMIWAEPLADSTVKAKGHPMPLMESGTLRDKASWAVRSGNTIIKQGGEQ